MKVRNIRLVALIVLGLLGCMREQPLVQPEVSLTRLTAYMELQPNTKAELEKFVDDRYYPLWEMTDTLAVFTEPGQQPAPFILVEGAGTTQGLFEGPRSGERYIALSPFCSDAKWDNDRLEFVLPERQNHIIPMLAVSHNGELFFKNLCSVIKLSLTGNCVVGSIRLHSNNHYLSGSATVKISNDDAPYLSMNEGSSHDVLLDCGAVLLNKETPTDFFISVPSGTYDGMEIVIDTYTEIITKSITHEIVLKRSELRPVSSFMVEAPMIDLDNLPDNQIWYKTQNDEIFLPNRWLNNPPLNVPIIKHTYASGYGIIITDAPITRLNYDAFSWGTNTITEIHLPDCVERIDDWAIPSTIETLRIPAELKIMGSGIISGVNDSQLKSIYGPLVASDSRSIVRDGVLISLFEIGLDDYVTPPEVISMSEGCLRITYIKTLTLSEGVESMVTVYGDGICTYAPNLESVFLPESLQQIDRGLGETPKLTGFYGSSKCTSADHKCLINPRASYGPEVISVARGGEDVNYQIPEGVTSFYSRFVDWPNLETVIVPESLKRLIAYDGSLFEKCPKVKGLKGAGVTEDGRCFVTDRTLDYLFLDNLSHYETPLNVRYIPGGRFSGAPVKSLVVSEGTVELGPDSFHGCLSLETVRLPTTIKRIGNEILSSDDNIESLYLPCRVPPVVVGAPSNSVLPKLKVYVPEESIEDYQSDPMWQTLWGQYLTPYHFDNIDPPAPYESSDYSKDGTVMVLQTASEGRGIDLVIMGNEYSDRQIDDGSYLAVMEKAIESFFTPEPYRSFRHLFNVYAVNIVSAHEDDGPGDSTPLMPYLSQQYDKCVTYALKAIPDSRLDEATCLMICQTQYHLSGYMGITSMSRRANTPETDYSSGLGVALLTSTGLDVLVPHEAGGHGFGKLRDEYISSDGNAIPESAKESILEEQRLGWWKNVDFTTDPSKVRWAKFLSDPRYESEHLGIFEGALNDYGIYRPSKLSIMRDSKGAFNAPSREAIYYRIHKLAYGPEWEYNYEDFVKWDQGAKNIHPTATMQSVSGKKTYEVREPLPSKPFNPDEWTVTIMK